MAANKNDKVRKVFISSTYVDLKDYRRVVIETVETFDELKPVAMNILWVSPKSLKRCAMIKLKGAIFLLASMPTAMALFPKAKLNRSRG